MAYAEYNPIIIGMSLPHCPIAIDLALSLKHCYPQIAAWDYHSSEGSYEDVETPLRVPDTILLLISLECSLGHCVLVSFPVQRKGKPSFPFEK